MAVSKSLWEIKPRIEHGYFRALHQITEYLLKIIHPESDPHRIVSVLQNIMHAPWLTRYAEETARQMVIHLLVDGARTWRQAAREGSKGRVIYQALKNELQGPVGGSVAFQIQRNAELIKTLPLDIAGRVTDYIGRETLKGRRAEDIAGDIKKMFPEASHAKASLIARTEVGKTSTALTRARSEEVGIGWYEWLTSEDVRVRSSHRHMDRVLVAWSDPPSPEELIGLKSEGHYHVGEIWNCRCFPAPVVDARRLEWPHRIYTNGGIRMVTLSQFQKLSEEIRI